MDVDVRRAGREIQDIFGFQYHSLGAVGDDDRTCESRLLTRGGAFHQRLNGGLSTFDQAIERKARRIDDQENKAVSRQLVLKRLPVGKSVLVDNGRQRPDKCRINEQMNQDRAETEQNACKLSAMSTGKVELPEDERDKQPPK